MSTHKFSFGRLIIVWFAEILYLSALSALLPVILLTLISPMEPFANLSQYVSLTALGMVVLSVFILFLAYQSLGRVFFSVGWITLVPGLGGLIFLDFQKDAIIAFFSTVFSWFPLVEPVVNILERSMPNLWVIAVSYIIIGFLFMHLAGKLEHKHALTSQIRKLFGRRAKILRN